MLWRLFGYPWFYPYSRFTFVATVLFGIVVAARAQGPSVPNDVATKTVAPGQEIVVGTFSDTYPYSFQTEPDGKVAGFAVDLLDALARVMDFKIRRVVLPGEEIKVRFKAGEYDMLQLLSEAKGRDAWADYSIPVLHTQNIILVRRSAHTAKSLEELKGARFAAAGAGSVGDRFFQTHFASANITYATSPEHALRLLESGQVDATILSRVTAVALIEKLKFRDIVELRDPAGYIEHLHRFAVHKGDTTLLAHLNEGLALLQSSGEYDQIYRKWLGRYEPTRFTPEQVIGYVATALAVALLVAVWAGLRQRTFRHRLAGQAEDLAQQGELLSALFENVPLAMCIFEFTPGDGISVRSLNRRACENLELSVAEAVGRPFDQLKLAPEWKELADQVLDQARQLDHIDVKKYTMSSSQRHLMVTRVPLAPRFGGVQRLCVLVEDVTERWRLDEEIAQGRRLRAIGELVGGIAHEFNNLMTPVMLKVGEVSVTHPDDHELQLDLAVVTMAVQRAAELTARLLTFGRKGERHAERIQLDKLIQGAVELLRPTFDRRIIWAFTIAPDLSPLLFNATDLNQIIVNLMLNARDTLVEKLAAKDAAAWTPRIHVEVTQLPPEHAEKPVASRDRVLLGWQQLTVRDNGMGIPPAVRERIFEPFYTTKNVGQGTGLGLATVWHLVAGTGGRIDLRTVPGEGSEFQVLLPIWSSPAELLTEKKSPGVTNSSACDILLVDDETLVADTIAKMLRKTGHRVYCLADGRAAWIYLQNNLRAHDLLIVDINLPGIDGIEFVRRGQEAGYAGRVLVVSGRLATAELTHYPDVVIDAILPKPFNGDELLAAVNACLSKERSNGKKR